MAETGELMGGCDCGAVRFTVATDMAMVVECNCSHCSKKGFILSFGERGGGMEAWERLVRFWSDTETAIEPVGASPDSVAAAERRLGLNLPREFREYLLRALPSEAQTVDGALTEWWGLDRLATV